MERLALLTYKNVKRIVVIIIGMSVLLVGIAMIVLPGPAILLIPAGLAMLATEFIWARILLRKIKKRSQQIVDTTQSLFFPKKRNQ